MEDLGPGCLDITLSVPDDMPDVVADADLLARILTALTAEALHRSPAGPRSGSLIAGLVSWIP